ncbi:MAG: LysE family transporter [Chloroflexi bacterium]|nr:LysE family transporter [Chloroflexota bacterium]
MILLRGFLIGFAIAAPVGPIGVLCIRRTLADGRLVGFVSGLGAATADMFYGAVAAFGLTAIQNILVGQQFWLHLLGGLFLLYLGARTFFTKPAEKAAMAESKRGLFSAYLSTLGLTLTNPATIISFTVVFAGILPSPVVHSLSSFTLVIGVFLGSAAWWLTLSGIVGWLRERFTPAWMVWVNRLAGIVIFSFGIAALIIK